MNKKILILIICLSGILTACSYQEFFKQYQRLSETASGGESKKVRERSSGSDAVSGGSVSGSGIHSADNVTREMQTAQYWIDRMNTKDKVLATQQEIEEFNKALKERLVQDSDAMFFDLDSFGESIQGSRLKELIGECVSGQLMLPFRSSVSWQEYYRNCNYEAIADYNKIRYGLICQRADVRALPTEDKVEDGTTGDILQNTALAINEPVLILHTSLDDEWYFVVAKEYAGWIQKEMAALVPGRTAWQEIQEKEQFLVVTADRMQTKQIPGDSLSGDYEFTMGTRLFLAENTAWQAKKREEGDEAGVYDSYVVKVPKRDVDGNLTYAFLSIPLGRDVNIGYMEYTRANVVSQAFKMLGNPYVWGGAYGERDCSSMIRDVYLCFGIYLPRNSSDMARLSEKDCTEKIKALSQSVDVKGLSENEKTEKLMGAEPGAILQMPGHAMIYLGCEDKNYFVLSARGGTYRCVMVNDLHAKTEEGKTWAEQLCAIVSLF